MNEILFGKTSPDETITKLELFTRMAVWMDEIDISWISTDNDSYDWTDIHEEGFLNKLMKTDFKVFCIGRFNFDTKETIYEMYAING